jgi:hypothetical protein
MAVGGQALEKLAPVLLGQPAEVEIPQDAGEAEDEMIRIYSSGGDRRQG